MSQRSALDEIRIASPCSASWDAMVGDDRQRFCASCGKDVYNIAAMTTEAALALVAGPGPLPCLQLYRREDGTTLTADCPVGVRAVRRRRGRLVACLGLGLTLLGSVASALGLRRETDPLKLSDLGLFFSTNTTPTPPAGATLGVPAPAFTPPLPRLLGKPAFLPQPEPLATADRAELEVTIVRGEADRIPLPDPQPTPPADAQPPSTPPRP